MARLLLFIIPAKYHPDEPYCTDVSVCFVCTRKSIHVLKVRLSTVHKFTLIQLFCLALVYVVKHFKDSALAFPFILMLMTLLRWRGLPKLFTEKELHAVGFVLCTFEDLYSVLSPIVLS